MPTTATSQPVCGLSLPHVKGAASPGLTELGAASQSAVCEFLESSHVHRGRASTLTRGTSRLLSTAKGRGTHSGRCLLRPERTSPAAELAPTGPAGSLPRTAERQRRFSDLKTWGATGPLREAESLLRKQGATVGTDLTSKTHRRLASCEKPMQPWPGRAALSNLEDELSSPGQRCHFCG